MGMAAGSCVERGNKVGMDVGEEVGTGVRVGRLVAIGEKVAVGVGLVAGMVGLAAWDWQAARNRMVRTEIRVRKMRMDPYFGKSNLRRLWIPVAAAFGIGLEDQFSALTSSESISGEDRCKCRMGRLRAASAS
jgi:hypothetical protein